MADSNQVRINELARELEIKAKVLIEYLPEAGVTEKKTHSSSIDLVHAERVRKHFRDMAAAEEAAEAEKVSENYSGEEAGAETGDCSSRTGHPCSARGQAGSATSGCLDSACTDSCRTARRCPAGRGSASGCSSGSSSAGASCWPGSYDRNAPRCASPAGATAPRPAAAAPTGSSATTQTSRPTGPLSTQMPRPGVPLRPSAPGSPRPGGAPSTTQRYPPATPRPSGPGQSRPGAPQGMRPAGAPQSYRPSSAPQGRPGGAPGQGVETGRSSIAIPPTSRCQRTWRSRQQGSGRRTTPRRWRAESRTRQTALRA